MSRTQGLKTAFESKIRTGNVFALNLTIIVCTRDRPQALSKMLARIRASRVLGGVPIVVHDDASVDSGEIQQVVTDHRDVQLLRSDKPKGPTGGRNACLRAAKTPFCLSLDDDVSPQEVDAIPDCLAAMRAREQVAVIGFRCFRPSDGDLSPGPEVPAGPISNFHGGASLLRRDAVLSVGGFRELLFFGGEDTDLALTLRRAGWEVLYEPAVIMEHDCVFEGRDQWRAGIMYARNSVLSRYAALGGLIGVAAGIKGALGKLWYRVQATLTKSGPTRYGLVVSVGSTLSGIVVGLYGCVRYRQTLRAEPPPFVPKEGGSEP